MRNYITEKSKSYCKSSEANNCLCRKNINSGAQEKIVAKSHTINPFPHNVYISYRIVKFLFKKKEGIMKKTSYERRAYESVDNRSLS